MTQYVKMERRDFVKFVGIVGGGSVLASCAPGVLSTSAKSDLIIANVADPQHLNPIARGSDIAAGVGIWNIFNTLVDWDYDAGRLVPRLATEWNQKDDTTWEFKLREGVQFHNDYGEFTADDVEFNVNYTIENESARSYQYAGVSGAKAIDKYTVEYYLDEPSSVFLLTTITTYGGHMVSKNAYEEIGEEEFGRNPVGTGAFMLDSWQSGSDLVLRKNPDYWRDDRPYLEEVVIKPIPEAFTRVTSLETGEVDMSFTPDYKDVAEFRQDDNFDVFSSPGGNWDYIDFNVLDESLPGSKKEVRQAIGYAIDRDSIVENIYFGEANPEDDPFPPGFLGADPDIQKYPNTADTAKAKELLAEAGFPDGFSITAITSSKDNLRRELQLVADQLSEVGIDVEIQNLDDGTYVSRWIEGDFEMSLEDITIITPDPDSAVWNFLRTGTIANHGHENQEMNDLIDRGRAITDEQERTDIYRRVTEIVQDEAPYLYTANTNMIRLAKEGLTGYSPSPAEDVVVLEDARWVA